MFLNTLGKGRGKKNAKSVTYYSNGPQKGDNKRRCKIFVRHFFQTTILLPLGLPVQ